MQLKWSQERNICHIAAVFVFLKEKPPHISKSFSDTTCKCCIYLKIQTTFSRICLSYVICTTILLKRGLQKISFLQKKIQLINSKFYETKLIKIWIFILNKSRRYGEHYNKIPRSTIIKRTKYNRTF